MHKIIEISKMLNEYPEMRVVFSEPVVIEVAFKEFWMYGAWKHPEYGIYVLDGAGDWHGPLIATQANDKKIIESLFERLEKLTHAHNVF